MKGASSSRPDGDQAAPSSKTGAERTTFDWPRHAGTTGAVLQEMETQIRLHHRQRRRVRAAASALVILLVAGGIWQTRVSWHSADTAGVVAREPLPTRQVLPDGSVVLLRAGAELVLDFTPASRRVVLTQGEALFEVATNPDRPFVVRAAGVDVRAVGTAFAVDLKQATVEVLVTEGKVAVEKSVGATPPSGSATTTTILPLAVPPSPAVFAETLALVPARNRVVVEFSPQHATVRPAVVPISESEINDRLAWRVAILQFSRTPLSEVIAMVNRHARARLVVEGDGFDQVRLSGAIRADNVDALLQLLESDHGISTEHRGETEIVLRKSR
jgi:transmembrane sensor